MKTTRLTLAVLALLAAAVGPASATLLYTNATVSGYLITGASTANGVTIGMQFTVGHDPIKVTALGVWDYQANGLLAAHGIGLWQVVGVTQTLVASNTIGSGTSGTLVNDTGGNGFRFTTGLFDGSGNPTSSVILPAGAIFRLGELEVGSEPYLYHGSPATFASGVTVTASASAYSANTGILTFPGNTASGEGYFGPNMEFEVIVPEPSTLLLIGAGGLVLAWVRRRRSQRLGVS